MTSYFNLMIRPYHQSTSRDMKELHLLAVAIDELRGGRLGQLGDTLAARFLAIHTAVNEGHWRSAQFLETRVLQHLYCSRPKNMAGRLPRAGAWTTGEDFVRTGMDGKDPTKEETAKARAKEQKGKTATKAGDKSKEEARANGRSGTNNGGISSRRSPTTETSRGRRTERRQRSDWA